MQKARREARDRDIPVLTDVLHERKVAPPTTPPAAKAAAPARTREPGVSAQGAAPARKQPSSPEAVVWDGLEERIKERILQQVAQRMDVVLDDRISQHVGAVLEQIARLLADEIKYDMKHTLDAIVTHCITTELDNLKKGFKQLR